MILSHINFPITLYDGHGFASRSGKEPAAKSASVVSTPVRRSWERRLRFGQELSFLPWHLLPRSSLSTGLLPHEVDGHAGETQEPCRMLCLKNRASLQCESIGGEFWKNWGGGTGGGDGRMEW